MDAVIAAKELNLLYMRVMEILNLLLYKCCVKTHYSFTTCLHHVLCYSVLLFLIMYDHNLILMYIFYKCLCTVHIIL